MSLPGLAQPRNYALFVAAAIALGVWLRCPAIDAGPGSDDYMEYAMLEGAYPTPRAALDLFNFADGSDADNRPLMDYGTLPWWTAPGLRLAMLRPLSSALVVFDHDVLGRRPVWHHVHTMVWWAALVATVAWLLYRFVAPPVAALSVLAFVCEEGHDMPVVWLANRGALVSLTLGLLGLLAHVRARTRGGCLPWLSSVVCLALSLAAGEWAFPAFAYLLAFEALAMRDPPIRRLRALLPAVVLGLSFMLVRSAMGYGVRQSGIYIDPVAEPLHFIRAAGHRIPVFFADLVYGIPSVRYSFGTPWRDTVLSWGLFAPSVWSRLPGWRSWHVLLGLSAMVGLVWTLRGVVFARARAADGEEPVPAWLWLGALLALIPVLGSFPSSRLVMPASIGVFAGLSAVAVRWATLLAARVRRRRAAALWPLLGVCTLAYLHLWDSARSSRQAVSFSAGQYEAVRQWVADADLDDARLAQQQVVLVSTTEHTLGFFMPFVLRYLGRPMPRAAWLLSGAMLPHDVYRVADDAIELRALAGGIGHNAMEQLYRDARLPFEVGQRVQLRGMRAEVLAVRDGAATRVRFTFDRSVDDPGYVFLEAGQEGLTRLPMPAIGERLRLARASFPVPGRMEVIQQSRDANVTCPGARPLIDDCVVGHAFADCGGGEGPPVLGCHGFGDCRWFVGGCLPQAYVASFCDADDPCCQDGWPFEGVPPFEHGPGAGKVAALLQAWGTQPWDARRALQLGVVVEPGLRQSEPRLECSGPLDAGPAGGASACGLGELRFVGAYAHSLSFAFLPPPASGGWGLAVDVVDDRARGPHARVCRVWQPTVFERRCGGLPPPDCAVEGEVRLSRLPAHGLEVRSLHGELRARFSGGGEVEGRF